MNVSTSTLSHIAGLGVVPIMPPDILAGRLAHHIQNWVRITRDRWVLDTVQGYCIEFLTIPYQTKRPHPPRYNATQNQLITEEVGELLQEGAVVEVGEPHGGFYSTLFLVPKKDGGQRPVINLKALNSFILPQHFKMEGIHTLKELMKPGDWFAKLDLKDAYFTIPMHSSQRKYLRFVLQGKTYEFKCLPFGLSSAPWVFTKTLKPVAALLREMGVRMVIYIDDILIMAESMELARQQVAALIYLLECLGFVIHKDKKSVLTPAQVMDFLGLTVDSVLMELRLPGEKIKRIPLCNEKPRDL